MLHFKPDGSLDMRHRTSKARCYRRSSILCTPNNRTYVLSGFRLGAAAVRRLKTRGVHIADEVDADTDRLIVRDRGQVTAKTQRATELGVGIITEKWAIRNRLFD
jgi:NAD-dependent DNA ligase